MNAFGINPDGSAGYLTLLIFSMSSDLQQHSVRVACYAKMLYEKALELGYRSNGELLPEKWLPYIEQAVLCHDLGKLMVPASVLYKEEPLNAGEWICIRQHPHDGILFLDGTPFFEEIPQEKTLIAHDDFYRIAKDAILGHHEHWDGNGYPYGLKGNEIPVIARICAIADAYDAIAADRIYQPSIPHNQACSIIEDAAGKQFEPELIEVFNHCCNAFDQR